MANLKKEDLINIIYTFSDKKTLFNNNREIVNKNKNNIIFNQSKSVELSIDNNSTINDFEKTINNFIKDNESNLLIIKFEENNHNNQKLLRISKNMIEKYIYENKNINKTFLYIVYKNRIIINDNFREDYKKESKNLIHDSDEENTKKFEFNYMNLFLSYNQQFIDNL